METDPPARPIGSPQIESDTKDPIPENLLADQSGCGTVALDGLYYEMKRQHDGGLPYIALSPADR